MVFDDVPTAVFPLYVVSVTVQEIVVPMVFWEARLTGGVHETEVAEVFVAIVPLAFPAE